jgi:co-chaperonin GroES (HSP10)
MNGKILATKLLIRPQEKKEKITQSGIILTNIVPDPCIRGTVLLSGGGTPQVEVPVKVGQQVLFPVRAPQQVRIDEEDLLLIDVRDVLYYF